MTAGLREPLEQRRQPVVCGLLVSVRSERLATAALEGQVGVSCTKKMGKVLKQGSQGSQWLLCGHRLESGSLPGTRPELGRWPWGWKEGTPLWAPYRTGAKWSTYKDSFFPPPAHHSEQALGRSCLVSNRSHSGLYSGSLRRRRKERLSSSGDDVMMMAAFYWVLQGSDPFYRCEYPGSKGEGGLSRVRATMDTDLFQWMSFCTGWPTHCPLTLESPHNSALPQSLELRVQAGKSD